MALAEKLSASQAEAVLAAVLRVVEGATDPDQLQALGQTAVALAEKLPAAQAEAAAEAVLAAVLRAVEGTTDPFQLRTLGQTAVALAQKLSASRAEAAAEAVMAPVLRAVEGPTNPYQLRTLGQTAVALAEKLPARTARDAADLFLVKLPGLDDQHTALAIVQLVHASLQGAGDEAYVRGLLDLMKLPATPGPATDFVLERLRERFPVLDRPDLHLWDVVTWAEATFPAIDLAGPPRLPPSADCVFA